MTIERSSYSITSNLIICRIVIDIVLGELITTEFDHALLNEDPEDFISKERDYIEERVKISLFFLNM
jgi:hypothetical protein